MSHKLSKVQNLINGGRYEDAQMLVEGILHREPANPRALCLLGVCLTRENRLTEAKTVIERSLGLDSADPESHIAVAELFRKQALPELTELHLMLALSLEPENTHAVLGLARLYRESGRYRESLSWYEMAECMRPDPMIEYELALEYCRAGDFLRSHRLLSKLRIRAEQAPKKTFGLGVEEIDTRRMELERCFHRKEGFPLVLADSMEWCVSRTLGMETEEILQIGKECEILVLMGALRTGMSEFYLQTLRTDVGTLDLVCLLYIGYQFAERSGWTDRELSKAFDYALKIDSELDSDSDPVQYGCGGAGTSFTANPSNSGKRSPRSGF